MIQVNEHPSEIVSDQSSVEDEAEVDIIRRRHLTKTAPSWHSDYNINNNVAYYLLTEDGEPSTF